MKHSPPCQHKHGTEESRLDPGAMRKTQARIRSTLATGSTVQGDGRSLEYAGARECEYLWMVCTHSSKRIRCPYSLQMIELLDYLNPWDAKQGDLPFSVRLHVFAYNKAEAPRTSEVRASWEATVASNIIFPYSRYEYIKLPLPSS